MSGKQYRILIHILAVVLGFTPPFFLLLTSELSISGVASTIIICLASLPLYLLNIRYLIPKLLKQGKHMHYFLALLATMIIYISIFKITIPFDLRRIQVIRVEGEPISLPGLPIPPMIPFTLMMLIGTTLEMLLAYENRGKEIEKTETEKIRAELSFLKSQINPHFFFNTLNSIYALAAIDSYNTQRAILLLSNLMRYLLYESNVEKVSLNKEIQFIHDFIGLQKLRSSLKHEKNIDFSYEGNVEEYKIEPLLLVPFVENAFKHSHSYDKKTTIKISISVEKNKKMIFKCSNCIGEQKEQIKENSGIGLENVKRRLALIYPKAHNLSVVESSNTFDVSLIINNEVHSR